jgi:pimeloyl-ACP methyl ester carboxylesterase
MIRGTTPRSIAATARGLASRPDRTADLPHISVPTLVLVGADDAITPPDTAREMASALPHATLEIIPSAGHLAPMERPEVVNRAILAFLQTLPPG